MALEVFVKRQLKGFSLDVAFQATGGILGILGPSGSGKSMTLRSIAGIDPVAEGRIAQDGRVLLDTGKGVNLRPRERKVGYLFQSGALFPHMTVAQNLEAAMDKGAKQSLRVMLERFQIAELEKRYPAQLSGGQAQRVALARCLAMEPSTLLLDEPFAALDAELREQMQWELLDLLKGFPGQTVLVTHNQEEAYRLCQRLVLFSKGRCVARGETRSLFQNPGNVTAARLTGCKNILRAVALGRREVLALDLGLRLLTEAEVPPNLVAVGIRERAFVPAATGEGENTFPVAVEECLEGLENISLRVRPLGAPEAASLMVRLCHRESNGIKALRVPPRDVLPLGEAKDDG